MPWLHSHRGASPKSLSFKASQLLYSKRSSDLVMDPRSDMASHHENQGSLRNLFFNESLKKQNLPHVHRAMFMNIASHVHEQQHLECLADSHGSGPFGRQRLADLLSRRGCCFYHYTQPPRACSVEGSSPTSPPTSVKHSYHKSMMIDTE